MNYIRLIINKGKKLHFPIIMSNEIFYTREIEAIFSPSNESKIERAEDYNNGVFTPDKKIQNTYENGYGVWTFQRAIDRISGSAFYGMQQLTGCYLPYNCTLFGNSTFEGCVKLETVFIPYIHQLGYSFFKGCTALKNIITLTLTPPKAYESVFKNVPEDCIIWVADEAVEAYKNATYWGNFTIKPVSDPDCPPYPKRAEGGGVYGVGFYATEKLNNIRGLYDVHGYEVEGYTGTYYLTSLYGIYNTSVPVYKLGGFKGNLTLNQFLFQNDKSIEIVGEQAFMGCENLTKFEYNNSRLRRIEAEAFKGCNIKTIRFNNVLEYVGTEAFKGNPITVVMLEACPDVEENAFDNIQDIQFRVVNAEIVESVMNHPVFSQGQIQVIN